MNINIAYKAVSIIINNFREIADVFKALLVFEVVHSIELKPADTNKDYQVLRTAYSENAKVGTDA